MPERYITRRSALASIGSLIIGVPLAIACGEDAPLAVATQTPTEPPPTATRTPTAAPETATPTPTPTVEYDPDLHQLVDKQRALPADYIPPDLIPLPVEYTAPGFGGLMLRAETAEALDRLMEEAEAAGLGMRIRSTYRSYEEQVATFQYWVQEKGEEQARRESAEAGHSEHQLGTTVDFASAGVGWELVQEFADTPEGEWLEANAHRFGFAMSYPPDAEDITGYVYEPWHFRYIGQDAAAAWREAGDPLIVFLDRIAEG